MLLRLSRTWRTSSERPVDPSNWLPAPAAPFRPIMRLYEPAADILDGTYQIPPITKAAS